MPTNIYFNRRWNTGCDNHRANRVILLTVLSPPGQVALPAISLPC